MGKHAARRERVRRRLVFSGRVVAALVTVAVIGVTAAGWCFLRQYEESLVAKAIVALVPDDPNIRQPGPTQSPGATPTTVAGAPENTLVLGVDLGPPGGDAPDDGLPRSDATAILHQSAALDRLDILSVPRDLIVPAPECQEWDHAAATSTGRTVTGRATEWPIADAYAFGGPQCSVKAIQALSGVRIDRVIVVNGDGFRAIVDAMGGVTLTVPGPVADNGSVVTPGGTVRLTGSQALALVRAYGGGAGGGQQGTRQHQLLAAMLAQAASADVVSDPTRLNATLQAIVDNSMTDNVTVQDLADLAVSLKSGGGVDINDYVLPTVSDPTGGLRSAPGASGYLNALVSDRPLPTNS